MAEEFDKFIRTPSVQHLAYHVSFDREFVAKRIRQTYEQKGRPSYNPTRSMFAVIMRIDRDDSWVRRQVDLLAEDSGVWREAIEACLLLLDYRKERSPVWFRKIPARMFQLPTGLVVPVNPAGLLRADGQVSIVWLQLWKAKRLTLLQTAFLYEVLKRTFFLLELENAELDFVDLGRPDGCDGRVLRVRHRADMPSISEEDFRKLCLIFHEEFDKFMQETGRPRPGAPTEVPMGIYPTEPPADPELF